MLKERTNGDLLAEANIQQNKTKNLKKSDLFVEMHVFTD